MYILNFRNLPYTYRYVVQLSVSRFGLRYTKDTITIDYRINAITIIPEHVYFALAVKLII